MNEQSPDLKEIWEKNKAQFEQLCQEEEQLYKPDFEQVFIALYEIEPEQKEVFNIAGWDMSKELPDTINAEVIRQAIQVVGLPNGEAANFMRYAEIILQAKKLMQANVLLNLQIELANRPQQPKPEGWRFFSVYIIASPQLHEALNEIIKRQAANGEGIFSNISEIAEQPDVEFDELLGVEVYNVACSYVPYYDDLVRYGVIGTTLGKPFAKNLFITLKELATFIKENTDKPEAVKAHIFKAVKDLDNIPIWGLLFQILILQGLCSLLENCNIAEGDNGYNEAASLLKWLSKLLTDKLIKFTLTGGFYGDGGLKRLQPLCDYLYSTEIGRCVQEVIFNVDNKDEGGNTDNADFKFILTEGFYGDGDLKRLQPLCDYPYSTEIGRCVQEAIFNSNDQEGGNNTDNTDLPSVLDTDRARGYFARAVDLGLMSNDYKWLKGLQLLSCFAREMSLNLNLGKGKNADGSPRISWKPFEQLFAIDKGKLRANYNDIQKTGQPPSESNLIDEVFS